MENFLKHPGKKRIGNQQSPDTAESPDTKGKRKVEHGGG